MTNDFPLFDLERTLIDADYMNWLSKTNAFVELCKRVSEGTTNRVRLQEERFLSSMIHLPALEEQHRIVKLTEEKALRINEAHNLQLQARDETETLFTRTRAMMFLEAIQKKSQRLDAAVILERGKFSYRPRNEPRFFGGAHPWIQIGEIEAANKYIRTWSQTLNDAGLAISRKFPKGTVLISIAATIGAVGILDFDCCIPDSIVAVTPREGYDSEFVYHYLTYLRTHLEEVAPRSAQKNINLRILAELPFPELPLSEQHRIVTYLNNLQTKVDILSELQVRSSAELEVLLPSILDRSFNAQL